MKTTFGSEPPTGEPPLRGYWSSQNLRFEARVAFDIFDLPKVTSGLVRGVPEPQVST